MKNFSKKLIELRKQKGLSQDELATDLNISQSSISNYESGYTTPDMLNLQKIADYFKVPVIYFFSEDRTIFYTHENHNGNIGNFFNSTFNTLSEKLFELYEKRIKDLEEEIGRLKRE